MYIQKDLKLGNSAFTKYVTLYMQSEGTPKACIIYFHGGGLLYGNRCDIPETHLETLTNAGYAILAYDYPLAPAVKLDTIIDDVCSSIANYKNDLQELAGLDLPYFLWGRSSGAYLCLLAASKNCFDVKPLGILSYYGYGFLCDSWFNTPSNYYTKLPAIPESCLAGVPSEVHANGDLDRHYSVYVYARQTGKWLDLMYEGRLKFFFVDYTLRLCDKMPCPIFCAHSTGDTDVPYSESIELCNKYSAQRFIASGDVHDFDRDHTSAVTAQLLDASVHFLDNLTVVNSQARMN